MTDYLVTDTELTSVANAIRTKGGTSASLSFPTGFVSAINDIQTGGGEYTIDDIAQNIEPSGDITLGSGVTTVGNYAFANKPITSVSSSAVTSIRSSAFLSCTSLESVDFPNLGNVYSYSSIFSGCTALESVNLPKLTQLGQYNFQNCTALKTLHLPSCTKLNAYNFKGSGIITLVLPKYNNSQATWQVFAEATNLLTIDMLGAYVQQSMFTKSTKLSTIVLRSTSVLTLANINAFTSTPFASSGSGGTLYVPSALISSYQSATNWSTILGYANNSIEAIEGSIYETQYADGTPIE